MNAIAIRDSLFSELHAAVLKPLSYRKKGHWSIFDADPFFKTIYLRASRWSNRESLDFWIDVQVFHRDWYNLLFSPKRFVSPTEGTPSLISEDLGKMCEPPCTTFAIDSGTDVSAMRAQIEQALSTVAVPILEACSTLESVLAYYERKNDPRTFAIASAGIAKLLGRGEDAKRHIAVAREYATHESLQKWIATREASIFSSGQYRKQRQWEREKGHGKRGMEKAWKKGQAQISRDT